MLQPRRAPIQAGEVIAKALSAIGVTEERVTKFLGRECGCRRRRKRLNELSDWAWSVLRGKRDATQAREELDKMIPP